MSQIISNLRIQKILAHFEFLQAKLNENLKNDDLIKFSKEYAELKPIYEHIQKFNKTKKELSEAKELFHDPEFKDLASDEVSRLEERLQNQEQSLQLLLLPKDVNKDWFETDFSNVQAEYNIDDDKLINTDKLIGINTVGQSLKNPSYDIRASPACPKFTVSPWQQSTIEPDFNIKPLM